jgi:hypothetical protein
MGGASVRRFRKDATTTLLWAHSVRPYTRLQGHADQERETVETGTWNALVEDQRPRRTRQ